MVKIVYNISLIFMIFWGSKHGVNLYIEVKSGVKFVYYFFCNFSGVKNSVENCIWWVEIRILFSKDGQDKMKNKQTIMQYFGNFVAKNNQKWSYQNGMKHSLVTVCYCFDDGSVGITSCKSLIFLWFFTHIWLKIMS